MKEKVNQIKGQYTEAAMAGGVSQSLGSQMNPFMSIRELTVSGLLAGITIFLGLTGYGFIPLIFMNATILHIPTIIGSVVAGPRVGIVVGFLFGFVFCAWYALPLGRLVAADPQLAEQRIVAGSFCGDDQVAAAVYPVQQALHTGRGDVTAPAFVKNQDALGRGCVKTQFNVHLLRSSTRVLRVVDQIEAVSSLRSNLKALNARKRGQFDA